MMILQWFFNRKWRFFPWKLMFFWVTSARLLLRSSATATLWRPRGLRSPRHPHPLALLTTCWSCTRCTAAWSRHPLRRRLRSERNVDFLLTKWWFPIERMMIFLLKNVEFIIKMQRASQVCCFVMYDDCFWKDDKFAFKMMIFFI